MHPPIVRCLLALGLAGHGLASQAADAFVPAGARATLSVEYVYASSGTRRSEGQYDPHEWRVKRSVNLMAELAAQATTAMPTLQAIDSAQMAELQGKSDKAQGIAKKMAPMMDSAQAIMAKCGEDEACITREAQKMGAAMQGTPQMATAMSAKKDAEALAPGASRYQAWRATAQTGSYVIEETAHLSVTDPICANKPRHRCTRDERRSGAGALTLPPAAKKDARGAAGLSAVEFDAQRGTLTVALPVPLLPLAYTETITTDEPAGTHDTPTPRGPQARQLAFRTSADGKVAHKPFTVPLKGGWRSQSGEQVIPMQGAAGEGGTLTVRWRFAAS